MFKCILTLLFCGSIFLGKAQIVGDSILYTRSKIGYKLYQGPMKVGNNRMAALTKNCERSWENYKVGKQMESFGALLIVGGLVCTITAVGDYHFNDVPIGSTPLILAGITLIGIGIPIQRGGVKKVKLSTEIFNQFCIDASP
ncbi:MAG: hypothetical protein WEC59_03480 [Salibacteraceae bacterium]